MLNEGEPAASTGSRACDGVVASLVSILHREIFAPDDSVHHVTITNRQLRDAFLSPQMLCYFEKKLSHLSPAEVGRRIEETLKFLNIATYCEGDIPVTEEIDDVWHYWILQTKEYRQLCRKLQGRQFLHHSSKDYPSSGVVDEEADLVSNVAMLGTYVQNYGPFEADRVKYWRLAAYLVEQCGWSVERLNAWLMGVVQPRRAGASSFKGGSPLVHRPGAS